MRGCYLQRVTPAVCSSIAVLPCASPQRCEIKKSFSFVEFERIEDAKEACEQLHGSRINGREIVGEWCSIGCWSGNSFVVLQAAACVAPLPGQGLAMQGSKHSLPACKLTKCLSPCTPPAQWSMW